MTTEKRDSANSDPPAKNIKARTFDFIIFFHPPGRVTPQVDHQSSTLWECMGFCHRCRRPLAAEHRAWWFLARTTGDSPKLRLHSRLPRVLTGAVEPHSL